MSRFCKVCTVSEDAMLNHRMFNRDGKSMLDYCRDGGKEHEWVEIMSEQQLPPDPQTPSSISPGEREVLNEIVSAIDRHTEAMNRTAAAFEKMAAAFTNIAMYMDHDVEMRHHAVK